MFYHQHRRHHSRSEIKGKKRKPGGFQLCRRSPLRELWGEVNTSQALFPPVPRSISAFLAFLQASAFPPTSDSFA